MAAFYDGFLFGMPTQEQHGRFQASVNASVETILRHCLEIANVKPPLRILDWGGGVGYYSNAFVEQGCDCTMIDIDSKACQYATETFGDRFSVVNADPVDYRFRDPFDLVFCNQVIEHSVNVVGLLEAIKRAVLPEGLVIITTPNQQCKEFYFRRQWLLYYLRKTAPSQRQLPFAFLKFLLTPWVCCDPPRHIHAFNRVSLNRALAVAGFSVLRSFGEYSDTQYYSPAEQHVNWRIRRLRSLMRVACECCNLGGIRLLHILSPGGKWGNNLVVFARPLPG